MRLTSFTVASGPAASSAVIVSSLRRPSSPPAALISSAARVWPFSEGRPRIAPGPDWIVMWPNFTGVSGIRPLAVSCAAASPTTASSPSAAPPSVTPSPARKSRRSRSLAIRPPVATPHATATLIVWMRLRPATGCTRPCESVARACSS